MRSQYFALMFLFFGCSTTLGTMRGVRMGLDATAIAVDPAYQLAVEKCDAREAAIVALEDIPDERRVRIFGEVRTRCTRIFEMFEVIRAAHEAALVITADTEPDIAKLMETLDLLREAWEAAKELLRGDL